MCFSAVFPEGWQKARKSQNIGKQRGSFINQDSQILLKKLCWGAASVVTEKRAPPPHAPTPISLAGSAVGLGEAASNLADAVFVASHSTVVLKVFESAFIVMSHENPL